MSKSYQLKPTILLLGLLFSTVLFSTKLLSTVSLNAQSNTEKDFIQTLLKLGKSSIGLFGFQGIDVIFIGGFEAIIDITATDDDYTVDEDSSLALFPLAGDSSSQGPVSLLSINGTIINTTNPQTILVNNGAVTINSSIDILFTPNSDYNGMVTIPYSITDGTNSASANENITISAINDAPIALNDTYFVDEDNSIIIMPLASDTDIDVGDSITLNSLDDININSGSLLTLLSNDSDVDGHNTLSIKSINATNLTIGVAQMINVDNGMISITTIDQVSFIPYINLADKYQSSV